MTLCRYASLLNYDIFIQPGTPSNWSKCQMYNNNNENWSYFVSYIVIYLGKSLTIISLFPQNLGVQRRPLFVLGASQDALLAKSLSIAPVYKVIQLENRTSSWAMALTNFLRSVPLSNYCFLDPKPLFVYYTVSLFYFTQKSRIVLLWLYL